MQAWFYLYSLSFAIFRHLSSQLILLAITYLHFALSIASCPLLKDLSHWTFRLALYLRTYPIEFPLIGRWRAVCSSLCFTFSLPFILILLSFLFRYFLLSPLLSYLLVHVIYLPFNIHSQIYSTTWSSHIHLEDGNCSVCRNIEVPLTRVTANPLKTKLDSLYTPTNAYKLWRLISLTA